MASAPRQEEPRGAWYALVACVVTILFAAGARSSLAVFLVPIETDLKLDRATLSTAGALTVLAFGLGSPLAGVLATRFGARQVMMASVALMALSGFGVAFAQQAWHLYLFAGLIPGLGFAGASGVPGTVLLAKWFGRRLGLATGIMSSAIPAGQGLFVPFAAFLILESGWRFAYLALGLLLAAVALPVLGWLASEPAQETADLARAPVVPPRVVADVWLLGIGYFACGFTDQFVGLHMVALASDAGLDPLLAAGSLSVLLVAGIFGSVASGPLADTYNPYLILAGTYLLRALTMPLLLVVGPGPGLWALGAFALLFGITYITNLAAGARLVRDRYGVQSVGALSGTVGLAHQVGGSIGIGIGGLSVSLAGGYGPAIVLATFVVLAGGLTQFLIPVAQRRRDTAG